MAMTVADRPHRILLVNFTPSDVTFLEKAGFTVEIGYLGIVEQHPDGKKFLPYSFPRPLFEYDIYVYNSVIPNSEIPSPKNLLEDKKALEPLVNLPHSMTLPIAFIGSSSGFENLTLSGLNSLKLVDAHEGLSDLQTPGHGHTFGIAELETAIIKLKNQVQHPVGQYIAWATERSWPINHLPVIFNRNGDEIAAYGTIYDSHQSRSIPIYLVLPQLKDNVRALQGLLEVLGELRPELFPENKSRAWYNSDEFAFAEEKIIRGEINEKIKEATAFVESKELERVGVLERFRFIKDILIATEDYNVPTDDRLSMKIRHVLEFLGFEVTDIDAQIKGAIRKEDFWVKDGQFFAITEVTGTANKNPKSKEYNDLLGRMTTIFKRRDLVPDPARITGLLIVNYDLNTHPFKRPKLYSGALEEIVESSIEQEIGLLSTVELYKTAIAVKDGQLSKEDGRALIKQSGRIEFRPTDAS
jgi:hypothetical protein